MKRFLPFVMLLGLLPMGLAGCSDTTSTETKKEVTTPEGSTTVTEETTVETEGENPPPAN